jgi:hypothetical protein
MNNNEGPIVEFPGMSVLETVVTFFVVPTIMSKPKKAKTSSITTIE